jgi:hypothetical protein
LTRINNKAKVRRLTRLNVLGQGKAKVISFEEIEEARAAHTAKDAIKGKGKRGRKRKSTALDADGPEAGKPELELELEVAYIAKEVVKGGKRDRKRKAAAQEVEEPEPEVARMIDALVPWRPPVAQII